jgi:hypothetical protein
MKELGWYVFFLVVILAVLGLAVLALERGWLGL